MAYYKFSKCPYCGSSIESFKITGSNDLSAHIGSTFERCMMCTKVYKTNKKPWNQMNSFERFCIYCRMTIGFTTGGLYIALPAYIVISFLVLTLEIKITEYIPPIIFIILWIAFSYRSFKKYKKWLLKLQAIGNDTNEHF